ncbi:MULTISPECIES: winged helix-turn-helix domain-containing protein [unclassified Mesorhizobium]|nr:MULTISPECIES: winged helix-turn-helix domain-containing protein [unclassified Mesorhizobium]
MPSGKQHVLHNRIHWAKFYMSKAGLLASRTRAVRCHRSRSVIAHQRP